MSDSTQPSENEQAATGSAGSAPLASRRRLLKLGTAAVPVAATLASKPALAWDCMSPSAWGSEQINPNTSLKGNKNAHPTYKNETWTCANWAGNTTRSQVSGAPWTTLFANYTTLRDAVGGDYTKVTMLMLKQYVATFQVPKGVPTSARACRAKINNVWVSGVLTSDSPYSEFQKLATIAQLNYLLLGKNSSWNVCLRRPNEPLGAVVPQALQDMASAGSYSPTAGVTWTETGIALYLSKNYIAVLA